MLLAAGTAGEQFTTLEMPHERQPLPCVKDGIVCAFFLDFSVPIQCNKTSETAFSGAED